MLQINDVWFGFTDDDLFENVSLVAHTNHRVGIVGRNGIGKSTLFSLITGTLTPDEGTITVPSQWRIAWLKQDTPTTNRTALEFVVDGHHELRRVENQMQKAETDGDMHRYAELYDQFDMLGGFQAEARAGIVLSGLGFSKEDFHNPYTSFSGGWRIRLNLAQCLTQPSELLLLDEPTNHLDLEATLWLQRWMMRFRGTVLVISHDRGFLDRVVTDVFHLERRSGRLYSGNYSSFEIQRSSQLELQTKTYVQQEKEKDRLQVFINRFRTYASKAKAVQSKIKMLERMNSTAPLRELSPYKIKVSAPGRLDRPMLSLDHATLGYGDEVVLNQVTTRIYPGDRIAVLGVNGAGKSTFLKSLAGEIDLLGGTRTVGPHTTIGYFAQHQLELLDGSMTAFEHLKGSSDLSDQNIRNFLGFWNFHNDDIFRPVLTFSGGEKARLVLALIARTNPSLLVLDEPTNHLDLEMREALSVAIGQYEGAVLLVAHDQFLLQEFADQFLLVSGGKIDYFDGSLEDYENLVTESQTSAVKPQQQERTSARIRRQERARERERQRVEAKDRNRIELRLTEIQEQLDELENVLSNPEAIGELSQKELQKSMESYGRLKKQKDDLEDEWLALAATE